MTRWQSVLACAVLGGFLAVCSKNALADDRRLLTSYVWPEQRLILETGVSPWCYQQASNGADVFQAVVVALNEWSQAENVYMQPDCSGGVTVLATGGNDFIYGDGIAPGCGFGALACVSPYPHRIMANSVQMEFWSLRSKVAVFDHELCHKLWDCGEMYKGHDSGAILCQSGPSIMDCGLGHALFIQQTDLDSVAIFVIPAPVQGAGFGTGIYTGLIFYGQSRKLDEHGIALDVGNPYYGFRGSTSPGNCTRTAIWIQTIGFPLIYSGVHGPCSPTSLQAVAVTLLPSTCYYVGAENALPQTWGRNLTPAGCT